ncbi:MAG TPA: DNA internalization-related competence protein ComEC/Rec2 [Burkholderiales bacterium]|nr:DNA internalization-related competence protein ComEC/Rec2 [Burkholderiales bacterium]
MTAVILSFAGGVMLLQLLPALPSPGWLWLAASPLACLARWRWPRLPAACALGFCWALALAQLRTADRLAPELEGRDLEVVGVVSGLPGAGERGVRFEFEPESSPARLPAHLPSRILLSWYRSPAYEDDPALLGAPVHPGERWRFTVRLRRPHGLFNPDGFDYEGWLLERGIGATGYVRPGTAPLLLGNRNSILDLVELVRESARDRFKRVLGETPAAGILAALAVGDQRSISAEEWRLFNRTGVTHLMSISGLHVTLVSGLAAWLAGWLWRRSPRLVQRLPARKAAAAAAIAGALGYSLIAGFAVPAQRTFWMVTMVAAALWSGRIASPVRVLALALAVVLASDPWAVLAPGFWLSFGAVALIFLVSEGNENPLKQWLRVQWAVTIGLAPAALFLFSQCSVVGPLANAVAIPVVSAVVTPLALLAALVPWDALLELAAWLTGWLLQFLEWCASLPAAVWQQHAPSLWAMLLALAGVVWLLAPRGLPWRAAGLALMLPAVALPPPAPEPGEAWITTLDVGQGLAVLVRTAHRALLYDAGPAFGADADSGERIIAPYLRAAGVARLDAMIVTHNDNDHAGGAASVLENFEVDTLLSSLPAEHPLLGAVADPRRCAAGEAWEWDGVRFAILHPASAEARARKSNDLSCVLKVSAGGRAMLLTGDIEKPAEAELVARDVQDRAERGASTLAADVLLVPHHGSRTSSTAEFLRAVAARAAVIPVGYRNRFGHPNAGVLARLTMPLWRTDRDGAVTVRLPELEIQAERARRRRYWHDAPS